MASMAYWEQVGVNLQDGGSNGETSRRYRWRMAINGAEIRGIRVDRWSLFCLIMPNKNVAGEESGASVQRFQLCGHIGTLAGVDARPGYQDDVCSERKPGPADRPVRLPKEPLGSIPPHGDPDLPAGHHAYSLHGTTCSQKDQDDILGSMSLALCIHTAELLVPPQDPILLHTR